MRIISKDKDYYDSIQGIYFDKSLIYLRTPFEVARKDVKDYKLPKLYLSDISRRLDYGAVGFCGELYPFISSGNPFVKGGFHCYYSVLELEKKENIQLNKYTRLRLIRYFERPLINFELFLQNRSPIFVYDGEKVIWNALLRTYEFQKIEDPYQAFQKIRMFMSNLASPEKEMPKIDDKSNLYRHGFDNWSFKKRK